MISLAIGADHRGYDLKEYIKKELHDHITWIDVGTHSTERADYPLFAQRVADLINKGMVSEGILLCGSGVGMSIAVNRYQKIYAALVWNEKVAHLAKEHDNANVLIIPADFVSQELAIAMINAWRSARFHEDRYQKRIEMIDQENKTRK